MSDTDKQAPAVYGLAASDPPLLMAIANELAALRVLHVERNALLKETADMQRESLELQRAGHERAVASLDRQMRMLDELEAAKNADKG